MFRRRCAPSSIETFQGIRFQNTLRRCSIFALVLMLLSPFSMASSSSAGEIVATLDSANSISAPGMTIAESTANYPPLSPKTTQLIVSISVNMESKGDFFAEIDSERMLFLKFDDVNTLKLNILEDRITLINNERFVSLSAIQNVTYSFNEKTLSVDIVGKTSDTRKTSVNVYPFPSRPPNLYYPRESSVFLNYGATYSYADPAGFQFFSLTNKLGIRLGDIFFVSDSLYRKVENDDQFVRLLSSATYERRDNLHWFVLGDQFANSGDLGSTLNIGGIGFSKLYKLDPYFITQPIFNLTGVSSFPSQAEIYVDGVFVGKHPIAPGLFELKNFYSYGGVHSVDVVIKDPFGNEQRLSYPMYFTPLMLREGLHEYSYNFGFLRKQYGAESNRYGKTVFSGFHRYGVTNFLNIGARAEGSEDIYNCGISTSFMAPRCGIFTVSLAGSTTNGEVGLAGSFQHSYQHGSFSTNFLVRGFSMDYATVGNPPSFDMIKYEADMGMGFLLLPIGNISLNYSERETHDKLKTQVVTTSYTRSLSKSTSLFATVSSTKQIDTTYGFFIGFNFNIEKIFAPRHSITKGAAIIRKLCNYRKTCPLEKASGTGWLSIGTI